MAFRLWSRATCRPVDAFAIFGAAAASILIVVNALFLQSGSRPAPFFAPPKPQVATGVASSRTDAIVAARPLAAVPVPQPVAARRDDPIADLIGPSPRIAAVQRVLSDYGYGQIKPTGMLDDATSIAIEKFQRERKLTVTGEVSDRLVRELTAMIGHPLE